MRSYSRSNKTRWETTLDGTGYCADVRGKSPFNRDGPMLDVIDCAIFDFLTGCLCWRFSRVNIKLFPRRVQFPREGTIFPGRVQFFQGGYNFPREGTIFPGRVQFSQGGYNFPREGTIFPGRVQFFPGRVQFFQEGRILIFFSENVKFIKLLLVIFTSCKLFKNDPQSHFDTFPEGIDHCYNGSNPQPPLIFYSVICPFLFILQKRKRLCTKILSTSRVWHMHQGMWDIMKVNSPYGAYFALIILVRLIRSDRRIKKFWSTPGFEPTTFESLVHNAAINASNRVTRWHLCRLFTIFYTCYRATDDR